MITDDRGRQARVRYRGTPLFARINGGGEGRRHRFYEVRWLTREMAIAVPFAGVLLLAVSFTVLARPWVLAFIAQLFGVMLVALGIVCVVSLALVGRVKPERYGAIFEHRDGLRRCRACAFSLEGLAPEGDGCVVCPECGAAWRLPSGDA